VNVSSSAKAGFYPTPESKNLIQSLKDLKKELSRFGKTSPDRIGYNRLVKNVDSLEESLKEHYRELYAMEGALEAASARRLTEKQRMMLRIVAEVQGETLYTTLIERVSEELDIPRSTVRWNLKGLRDTGLITAGDRENKGVPVRLTEKQRIMLRIVSEVQGETLYTTLIERVSEELDIPRSTVRWNLKGLRDAGLIAAGDRDNKGVPVRLTETGRVMASVISSG
jgi:DNA-binding transcriptional ArsR family regulator